MELQLTRRHFLKLTGLGVAGAWLGGCVSPAPRKLSPNERLNIGVVGTANRARANLNAVAGENIVALCDVDETFLAAAKEKFPGAKTYHDFRKLLEQRDIDAVVISTADHTHAVAIAAALRLGKHVYCEKPLTHTVDEARQIRKLAAANKRLATQMGTQIHATNNYRRSVELVQSGLIGAVTECHVWCEKNLSPAKAEPGVVPAGLRWDLWLGPVPARPYSPAYVPKTWRAWWAFGEGILGDMACHYMDLAFWALKLHYPTSVHAEGPPPNSETVPPWMIVRYEFPARAGLPAVRLAWYDGVKRPPQVLEGKTPDWRNGVLFVGDKGMVLADYGRRMLLPESTFAGVQPPAPSIPDSIGHHEEWIRACKTGAPTTCGFDYAGPLTEAVLLGNVSYRASERLDWNGPSLKAKNSTRAANFLRTEYRKGWQL